MASGVTVTGASYYNLGVGNNPNSTPTTFTLGGNTTVGNILTVGDAGSSANDTLDGSTMTLTLSGTGTPLNVTAFGLFTPSSSTVNYTGTSSGVNITAVNYYNLGVGTTGDGNTVTYILLGNSTVSNVLTVGASSGAGIHSLNAGGTTLTLSGGGTPFVINSSGSFTSSTSTIIYSGAGSVNLASVSYYNLNLNNASGNYVPASTLVVTDNLTVPSGTLA